VWSISPGADGRLPVQNRAVLVDGVTVLGSREVVPMWAMRPEDGATLKQVDPIQQPDPNRDCPRWLLHEFGVSKWEKVS
jgi:hypothetical protein